MNPIDTENEKTLTVAKETESEKTPTVAKEPEEKVDSKNEIKNVSKEAQVRKKGSSDLDSLRYMLSWQNVNYDQIPSYMKDNDYIQTGYRPMMQSHWLAFSSVFRLHNETMNIWTHFVGILIYFLIFLKTTVYKPANYSLIDYLMISSHCIINMITFTNSSVFHIMNCLDEATYDFWSKLGRVAYLDFILTYKLRR